jgi:hypothetical protein
VRVFNLISTVAYIWAVLKVSALLYERWPIAGSWQLTVGLLRTNGALLGNLGEGWAEPGDFENNVGGCTNQHLLWNIELEKVPDAEEQQRLAFKIGDRLEDAWEMMQRRYLAHRGDCQGSLDLRRTVE